MAYVKNIWVDQDVERPKTYEVTNNQDGSITLTESFGIVTELGTPVNEVNMNHIEDGIDGCAIRKHNLTETFNLGEWVLGGTGDDEGIYKSLVSNNVGNAISDDTKWEKVEMGGNSRNIGEIVASTIPLTDAGLHLLDGALLQYGSYQAFIDYIAGLYDSGDYTAIFDTEANWQSAVTTYGVCGKFVYDSVNNTVRLPKITGFIEGTDVASELGDLVEAGLPNIEGYFYPRNTAYGVYWDSDSYENGALYKIPLINDTARQAAATESNYSDINALGIDASRSNTIYGNSNTVQPQSVKVLYYIVIATTTKTAIQVDIDEIATDLNGKMDVDGSNANSSVKNFDGVWVSSYSSLSTSTTLGTFDVSLSTYLPNDNYNYEVLFAMGMTNANSGASYGVLYSDLLGAPSDLGNGQNPLIRANTDTRFSQGWAVIPISTVRKITYKLTAQAPANFKLSALGYRRIGTNQ